MHGIARPQQHDIAGDDFGSGDIYFFAVAQDY